MAPEDIATIKGLSEQEAAQRLAKYGPNRFADQKRLPGMVAFLARFKNPLVITLLLAATLSAFLGDVVSFFIILAIITLSVVLDFVNTYRSEKAAEALKNRVKVLADVIRDGKELSVPLAHLVPGDIVRLSAGRLIPADGKVYQSKDLYVNESALNGESFPQIKPADAPLYMGSSVTSGSAYMELVTTGKDTKFAHIAQAIGQETETEFDREIKQFSLLILRITFVLVVSIFAFNAFFKHDLLGSLLFSLALAVGLTPELLPLIITLNLTKGSLAMARHGVIVKQLSAIQNFGSMDVLCTDKTGTLTEDRITLVQYVDGLGHSSEDVLHYSYLVSAYTSGFESPLDRAVKEFRHLSTKGYAKLDEIPFTFERKRESVIVRHDHQPLLITEGAPEEVMPLCTSTAAGHQFATATKKQIHKEYELLSSQGYRVLAVATRTGVKPSGNEADQERDLVFQGFIAFLDPAKKSVSSTIEKIRAYGVEIKIISGDNDLVNRRIASEINLPTKGLMLGTEIDRLNDAELAEKVEQTTIFARVSPEQKLRIIHVLQHNGHVVGYMGDGINDAPALKAADTGISVNNAVDVAKGTADLILLHKSLDELIEGVIEGRRTFANTLKYLMMALSSNFGNMFSMAAASIFLPFLPMLATQILFNNLIYDTSQFALPQDNVDEEYVNQPHRLSISGIKKFMWVFGPLSSLFDFATFGALLFMFHLGERGFQAGWFLESILTQIFVVYIIRTRKLPFIQSRPSWTLVVSTLTMATLACVAVLSPFRGIFRFGALPPASLVFIAVIVIVYLAAAQIAKAAFYRRVSL